jgi:hypothetical protein
LVSAALLDGKRLVFETLDSTWGGKIYGDVWPAFDFLSAASVTNLSGGMEAIPAPGT